MRDLDLRATIGCIDSYRGRCQVPGIGGRGLYDKRWVSTKTYFFQ